MRAHSKGERTALEQKNDVELDVRAQGQANDIVLLRKQLNNAQLADAEEDLEAIATTIEIHAETTATERNNLNTTIDHHHKIATFSIAQATAFPQAYDEKKCVSIGGGHFKGENAVAISFSKNFSSTNQYPAKISASSSSGGNIDFGYSF